jgi:UDP-N-acetylmuramoylalanine--D-glutamate ligase
MKPRPDLPPGPYLVVGLARSGIAAALALHERGERVIGVDAGEPGELQPLRDAGLELRLADSGLKLLEQVKTIVKSPGVPREAPVVAQARALGIRAIGELELAWRMLPNEFIAVTGTNGKTTTVELIGHIHRQAGLPAVVAGNVGLALSALTGQIEEQVTVVCEASSFQLEDTLAFSPEAAVLLNVSADHLDRHHTLEAYEAAKLEAFARQQNDDVAVVPAGFEAERLPGKAKRVSFGAEPQAQLLERPDGMLCWEGRSLIAASEISLRGRHNLENAMAAAAVCLARGVDPDGVRSGLRSFPGVPHRLEEVARRDGVLFVNDSKATNIASTLVALAAMAEQGGRGGPRVHLILGGQGKCQDFSSLSPALASACRAVYLIGEDAPAIAAAVADAGVAVRQSEDLERAVAAAGAAACEGEIVLLSPGCASFDQFRDFEARGERFRELVLALWASRHKRD